MIADIFLTIIGAFIALVSAPLPTVSLGISTGVESVSGWLGALLGPLDPLLPIHEVALCVGILVVVWLPTMAVYAIANWIYRHIPVVGGG